MRSYRKLLAAVGAAISAGAVSIQPTAAETPVITQKLNAYIECINRLSERSYDSRSRYFSWVGKKGPTGKEPIIYGTYTIYETADCKSGVEAANALEPHETELEAAASAYVAAVVALEPLLQEADDYYEQENYKDDKMAKGKAMHPRLVEAWNAFASADVKLRDGIDAIQDKMAVERLAEIEKAEGRKALYHVEALMMRAKRLIRSENVEDPKLDDITSALADYESIVKETQEYAAANTDSKIDSSYVDAAKEFLVTAKQLMRRIRDKVPYDQGEQMMIDSGAGAWMVEGSPARLSRDYNQLVEAYNRRGSF